MKSNQILFTATLLGALAVVLGAFGAHGLSSKISPERLEIYKLGVSYQYYHVMALLAVGILSKMEAEPKKLAYAAITFLIGIVMFSGSLYLLAIRDYAGLNSITAILGPMTPIGGVFLIVGWILTAISVLNFSKK